MNLTWRNSGQVSSPAEYAEVSGDGSGFTNLVPVGTVLMWYGSLTNFDTDGHGTNGLLVGWQLCNGSNGAPDLRGMFVKGWANGVDPGGTGGGPYTPQGSVAAPTLSGSTATEASHTHSFSPAGFTTISNFTPAGTIAWPAGVPTFTGTVPTVTNVQTIALVTGSRQVATNGAATPAGTIAWPAGVPTFTGNAMTTSNSFAGTAGTTGAGSSHSHGVGTLAATAPAFTGTQATVEPAYMKLVFIIKQ